MSRGAPTLLLVGCGKMGGALLEGWLREGTAQRFLVVEPAKSAEGFRGRPGVELYGDAAALPPETVPDVVVLAVKPQAMAAVLPSYRRFAGRSLFVSIAAGTTLGFLARGLGAEIAAVRAMPNTPAAIGRGIAVLCANPRVTAEEQAVAERLLAAVGEVGWVEDEALIDPVTAVSGSGPAYVFLLIEALAEAGIAEGLPAALAARLARATVIGSGELARLSPETPAQLRINVTSPGGTTEAALKVLMGPDGLPPLLRRAVAAATRRSRELAT